MTQKEDRVWSGTEKMQKCLNNYRRFPFVGCH